MHSHPVLDDAVDFSVTVASPSTPPSKSTHPTFLDRSPSSDGSNGSSAPSSSLTSSDTLIGSPHKKSPSPIMSALSSPTATPTVTIRPSPDSGCSTPAPMVADIELDMDPLLEANFAEALAAAITGLNEDQTELVTKLVKAQHAVSARFESNLHSVHDKFVKTVQLFSDYRATAEADNKRLQDKLDTIAGVNAASIEAARAADKVNFDEKIAKLEMQFRASEERAAKLIAEAEDRYSKAAEERAAKLEADRAVERAEDQAQVDLKLAKAKSAIDAEKAEEKMETSAQLAKIVAESQSVAAEVVDLRKWVLVEDADSWSRLQGRKVLDDVLKFLWASSKKLNPFNPPASGSSHLRKQLEGLGPAFEDPYNPTPDEDKRDYALRRAKMEELVLDAIKGKKKVTPAEDKQTDVQKALTRIYNSNEAMDALCMRIHPIRTEGNRSAHDVPSFQQLHQQLLVQVHPFTPTAHSAILILTEFLVFVTGMHFHPPKRSASTTAPQPSTSTTSPQPLTPVTPSSTTPLQPPKVSPQLPNPSNKPLQQPSSSKKSSKKASRKTPSGAGRK